MVETKFCHRCNTWKTLDKFYVYKKGPRAGRPVHPCIECNKVKFSEWSKDNRTYSTDRRHILGLSKPQSENKECSNWLGIHVAERLLPALFKEVTRMYTNCPGIDFKCGRGFGIDVKSSCFNYQDDRSPRWIFVIKKNKIADYFLCIAFDDRDGLNPLHAWLIPGYLVNNQVAVSISDTSRGLSRFRKYEKPIDEVVSCCNTLKDHEEVFYL